MQITGICTFCISQDRNLIVGYLLVDHQTVRVSLKPADKPPKMHQCIKKESVFYDLKIFEKEIFIANCQSNQQEYLQFTTDWDDSVQDRRNGLDYAMFSPLLIKVGEEAMQVVEKMFPAFKNDSDCTICVGELQIGVNLEL